MADSLKEILPRLGGLGPALEDFLSRPGLTATHRETLSGYLTRLSSQEAAATVLGASLVESTRRLRSLWEAPLDTLPGDPRAAVVAAAAGRGVRLMISEQTASMRAHTEHSGAPLTIEVNPLFAAVLSNRGLIWALAHEVYHHRASHPSWATAAYQGWLSVHPEAPPEEQNRVRSRVGQAIDIVTNAALGIDGLELRVAQSGPAELGRHLFCLASWLSSSRQTDPSAAFELGEHGEPGEQGDLGWVAAGTLPVWSLATCLARYHTGVDQHDSLESSLSKLLTV